MDKAAEAQFFKQAILMLQIEERQIQREIAAEKREHDRDKRRWSRLWKVLGNQSQDSDVDDAVDTAKQELLTQVQKNIRDLEAKVAALG